MSLRQWDSNVLIMRKITCFGFAAAMLFATACSHQEQKEELGTNAVVSFSVGLDSRIDTRAISDGKGVDQLMYAVFNEDGSELVVSKVTINDAASMIERNPTNGGYVDITLPKGHTYKVVFWAQNSECDAYTVSDDMKSLRLTGGLERKVSGEGKVYAVEQEIGKLPILTFGNDTGDLYLAKYTDVNGGKSFIVVNDDPEREHGNPEEAQSMKEECDSLEVQTISVKEDFRDLYAPAPDGID